MTDRKINDAVTGVVRYAGFHSDIQSNTLLQRPNCDICLEELQISRSVYLPNKFMPFAVNLERKEILFLPITMKAREKDIQINDKSTVSVFVSLRPPNNAVFDKHP